MVATGYEGSDKVDLRHCITLRCLCGYLLCQDIGEWGRWAVGDNGGYNDSNNDGKNRRMLMASPVLNSAVLW